MTDSTHTREQARRLLEDPAILDRAARFMDDLGLCGEEANRRMVFLAGIGGLLGKPIHLIIKGDSSGGKNTLANTALRLLPKDSVLSTSGLSPKALAYHDEVDEEGRKVIDGVLVIDEAEGIQGAEYALRQAMSEQRVARLTVGKDESGRMGGKKLEVSITASIITTTTRPSLHRENQTRVFDLYIDESAEQTRRVLDAIADGAAGGGSPDVEHQLQVWHEAINLLAPLDVFIPFARELGRAFPVTQLRVRRDFGRVLSLVAISALLHQRQRLRLPDGRLIADIDDYRIAFQLLQEVLEPTIQNLTPTAFELCELHDELVGPDGEWVRRSDLEREASARRVASPNTVHDWCRKLTELGYWQGETRGPHSAWHHRKIRDPDEEPVLLPRPEDLEGADLPAGPSSLVGRRTASNEGDSGPPPSSPLGEGPHDEPPGASARATPSLPEDWEAAGDPHENGENSSHPPDREALDPWEATDEAAAGVPAGSPIDD